MKRELFCLLIIVIIFSSCDPFAYNHQRIDNCAEAISFHNTKGEDFETASQFLDESYYAHLNGAIISFVKDTSDQIRLKIVMEWEQHDIARFKPDTITVDDVKWYSSNLYIDFKGGATSHISAVYDHDYRITKGFHIRYLSEPVREEIINQIIELKVIELSVSTSGVRAFTEKKIPCRNLSFALKCLNEL